MALTGELLASLDPTSLGDIELFRTSTANDSTRWQYLKVCKASILLRLMTDMV
jgi:hypothetical protein